MKKILIVDDELTFVNDLAEGLEIFGYEVYKAVTGKEAIEAVEKAKPEIVLCDYKLPDIDGDSVLKQVKERNSKIKFIMVTAYYDEELKERFKKMGADEVIFKPIMLDKLEKLLKSM